MNNQRPYGDAAVPARQAIWRTFSHFPGPVAIACLTPDDAAFRWRAEDMDGRPWALEAVYSKNRKTVLTVRTVRGGSLEWQPAFETVETLRSTMFDDRDSAPSDAAETVTSLAVEGVSTQAVRIDHAGRSGVHVEWQGQKVFCVGDTQLIDNLTLRAATSTDFADYATDPLPGPESTD